MRIGDNTFEMESFNGMPGVDSQLITLIETVYKEDLSIGG